MFTRLVSADLFGIDGRTVEVEVDVQKSKLGNFVISGLPSKGIRESRERIRSAILNSGHPYPGSHRILVNLAPAAWEKRGSGLDLPIALGILVAQGTFRPVLAKGWAALGELTPGGATRAGSGTLGLVSALRDAGYDRVILPAENWEEGSAVPGVTCIGVTSIDDARRYLVGEELPRPPTTAAPTRDPSSRTPLDFSEVIGHERPKRAIALAVAGEHNLLFVGSPGAGKSLLARRIPGLLPDPTDEEILEITKIHSAAGLKTVPGLLRC
ncbi:MAG: ATP-binding protein, partial [Planctomycetes bacterium]|nr:ATP-binding protein [Planctomycetota bacterium]